MSILTDMMAKLGEAGVKVTCVIDGGPFEIQNFGEGRLARAGPKGVDAGIKPGWTNSSIPTRQFS